MNDNFDDELRKIDEAAEELPVSPARLIGADKERLDKTIDWIKENPAKRWSSGQVKKLIFEKLTATTSMRCNISTFRDFINQQLEADD